MTLFRKPKQLAKTAHAPVLGVLVWLPQSAISIVPLLTGHNLLDAMRPVGKRDLVLSFFN